MTINPPSAPILSGVAFSITINIASTSGNNPVQGALGTCDILNSGSNPVYTQSASFGTDQNGNGSVTIPGTAPPGDYDISCSSPGTISPPYYGSSSSTATFEIEPGVCAATDASGIDSANSNSPSYITWKLNVTLNPAPSSPPPPGSTTGTGVTGQQTGLFDCNTTTLTTSPQAPTLQAIGYTPINPNGVHYSWKVTSYVYQQGAACTTGNCNGIQSLGVADQAPVTVYFDAQCAAP
jgi:hypothetical protein